MAEDGYKTKLIVLLRARNWSGADLAKRAHVVGHALYPALRGIRRLKDRDRRKAVADVMGKTVEELFDNNGWPVEAVDADNAADKIDVERDKDEMADASNLSKRIEELLPLIENEIADLSDRRQVLAEKMKAIDDKLSELEMLAEASRSYSIRRKD